MTEEIRLEPKVTIPCPIGYGTEHWNGPDRIPNWHYYRKLYFVHDPAYQETHQHLMKEMMHRVMLQQFPLPPRDLVVIGAH